MKLFRCQHCGQVLYFENTQCERCSRHLGFLPEAGLLSALEPDGETWMPLAAVGEATYRFCENATRNACNWLIRADRPDRFCVACRHNRTVPDLSAPANFDRWRELEIGKHRLFYTLLALHLPLASRAENPTHGLAFDFLADSPEGGKVMTGHDNGVITLNVAEADSGAREQLRKEMGEPYRTVLGHFRHESGHYFWDALVRGGDRTTEFRRVFGDERQNYADALATHYARGAPPDWRQHFVSAYASSHPWEDFAETWAHYLHIVDTLETASAFRLSIRPPIDQAGALTADIDFDPHAASTIEQLVDAWLPLTFAVNSLNRSMGQPDLYPFVLSPTVIGKLGFIHELVRAPRDSRPKETDQPGSRCA